MRLSKRGALLCGAMAGALAFGGSTALAQEAAPKAEPPADQVEELVVTARKFDENLQDSPIAITAFSSEGLVARGMNNLADISRATPSLVFSTGTISSGNSSATSVFLRGVGQSDFTMFTEPAVGIYLDGVYIARSVGASMDFLDVDQVEVLRGPQGTLFGRNTIGGVIDVATKRPSGTFGGAVVATTGSDNRIQLQGVVNVPISDTLRTKASIYYHKRDGYVLQVPTGVKLGGDNALAGRFQVEWQPASDVTVTFTADATHKDETATPTVAIAMSGTGFTSTGQKLPAGANNAVSVYNRSLGGVCATNPDSSRNCVGAAWQTNDPYKDNGSYHEPSILDVYGLSNVVEWSLGGVSMKSITAYRNLEAHYGRESDDTPLPFAFLTYDDTQEQFSQEFQFNGKAFSDRLKWVAGLYGFKENANEHFQNTNLGQATTDAQIRLHNTNFAAFGEAIYDVTPWLHLTAGGRWTTETKKFQTDQFIIGSPNPALVGRRQLSGEEKKATFDEFTPRFILSADVTPNTMVYGTYSKGFKSGGFNGRYTGVVPAPSQPIPFNPEFVTLYETGVKFTGFDRRLRLNLAAFRMNYSDIQVTYRPDPTQAGFTVTGNAAAARIDGAEVEATFVPISGLQIEGGLSYLDARYTQLGAVPGLTLDTPFPNTPKWTTNLAVSYDVRFASGASLTPRVDWSYRTEVSTGVADDPPLSRQPAYHLVNLSLAYVPPGRDWRFIGGITNLTDERYTRGVSFSAAGGLASAVYARPREWYLTLRHDF